MDLTRIVLTTSQIAGNIDGTAIALGIIPGYKYENGIKTDEITCLKVSAVFPNNAYEKMTIKVNSLKTQLTQEAIMAAGGQRKVKFINLRAKIYRTNNGDYAISVSADEVEVM